MAGEKNTARNIFIVIVLVIIGILAWQGYSSGFFSSGEIGKLVDLVQKTHFQINIGIILFALFILINFVPPFNGPTKKGDGSSYIIYILMIIGSIVGAYLIEQNFSGLEIYNIDMLKGFFMENGKFNYKPITSAGLIWLVLSFIVPSINNFLKRMRANGGTAFFVLTFVIAIYVASMFAPAGIWEQAAFKDGENFLLGARTNSADPLAGHTGSYTDKNGEISYGIFSTSVDGEKDRNPLLILFLSTAIFFVGLTFLEKKAGGIAFIGEFKGYIAFFLAAQSTNTGTTLGSVTFFAYIAIVFWIKKMSEGFGFDKILKSIPLILGIYAAEFILGSDLLPEMFNKGFGGGFVSILFAVIIGGGWTLLSESIKHGKELVGTWHICVECGSEVKVKGGKPFCEICSVKCQEHGCDGTAIKTPIPYKVCEFDGCPYEDKKYKVRATTCAFSGRGIPEHGLTDKTEEISACNVCGKPIGEVHIDVKTVRGPEVIGAMLGSKVANAIRSKFKKQTTPPPAAAAASGAGTGGGTP